MYVIYKKVIFQSTNICYKSFKNTIKLQQLTQSDTGIGKDKKKRSMKQNTVLTQTLLQTGIYLMIKTEFQMSWKKDELLNKCYWINCLKLYKKIQLHLYLSLCIYQVEKWANPLKQEYLSSDSLPQKYSHLSRKMNM